MDYFVAVFLPSFEFSEKVEERLDIDILIVLVERCQIRRVISMYGICRPLGGRANNLDLVADAAYLE